MSRTTKLVLTVLILATFVQAIAVAYILGFESGVDSRNRIIEELQRQLHPEFSISFGIWSHPLRAALFDTGLVLSIF
jgi:hypothetical protein